MSKNNSKRVFLDINIGDSALYNQLSEEYNRAIQFLKESGSSYGLSSNIEDLDSSGLETLKELYESNPTWTAKGPMRTSAPPPLRAGRIVLELFASEAPKTVENFVALCTGEKGKSKESGKMLHYKGCRFHRIVKDFVWQGGDFTRNDGSGGESIFGKKFNDEKGGLKLKHDAVGILSMANSGKNSNSSQFFITLVPCPQLDGKHVVFGKVVEGLDIVKRVNEEAASADGKPKVDVIIADCGIL